MTPPWGTKQLRRLGEALRDGREPPAGSPPYRDVTMWFTDLAATVQSQISDLDWHRILGDTAFDITSRSKTIDTLRQKLQRDRHTPLPSIQDIAGVRFEADMSISVQDEVARKIAELFGHDPDDRRVVKDLRTTPHSGYRAVHVWLKLPDGRVEVQIRTALQGAWANVYERAADVFGREIRYGQLPRDQAQRQYVQTLIALSEHQVANFEEMLDSASPEDASLQAQLSVGKSQVLSGFTKLGVMLEQLKEKGV